VTQAGNRVCKAGSLLKDPKWSANWRPARLRRWLRLRAGNGMAKTRRAIVAAWCRTCLIKPSPRFSLDAENSNPLLVRLAAARLSLLAEYTAVLGDFTSHHLLDHLAAESIGDVLHSNMRIAPLAR